VDSPSRSYQSDRIYGNKKNCRFIFTMTSGWSRYMCSKLPA
jgi:hypothetical protein